MAIESLGEVDSPLGTLRCTLRAWESINTHFGSYGEAYRRVAQLDAAAIVRIVTEGTGKKFDDVKPEVFRAGLNGFVKPLTDYLELLSNGGKKAGDVEADSKGEG